MEAEGLLFFAFAWKMDFKKEGLDIFSTACYNSGEKEVDMSEITAILPQKRDKERCSVYVDGQFYCGLTLETAVKNRLKQGQAIDVAELDRMQFESEKVTALDKALKHISVSMKTEKGIVSYLRKKGYVDGVIDYVVEKMKSYGFINDEEYARLYVQSASKGKGRHLIAMELQKNGIHGSVAEEAVERIENEDEVALKVLQKYMRGKTPDQKTLYKAFRYLIGKGFEYDTVKGAISAYGETDEDC